MGIRGMTFYAICLLSAVAFGAVNYRGIFVCDEDWGLRPWACQHYGDKEQIGVNAYREIFAMMKEYGVNTIWPAMRAGGYEFVSRPANIQLAFEMNVTIGSSTGESMMRNPNYVKDREMWDFAKHADFLSQYWNAAVSRYGTRDVLWTLGMAGTRDFRKSGRTDAERIKAQGKIMAAQMALLEKSRGNRKDIKVVFFGPCAAKKNESDRAPDELALAVTFPSLERFLGELGIDLAHCPEAQLSLGPASEGRFYSVEGGMNDTLRDGTDRVRYVSVSGLDGLRRLLSVPPPPKESDARPVFIECLACPGGCVNGPAMKPGAANLETLLATDATAPIRASTVDSHCGGTVYRPESVPRKGHVEIEIAEALARIGKFTKSDEVNCGACGYESCRAFALAMLDGKAEEAMCHTYLKQNFQRTSNALIKYIPAGVVLVGPGGAILECNRQFAELVGAVGEFDALGGSLGGMDVGVLLPEYAALFTGALEHGSEIEKFRQPLKDRLINISVFSIAKGESAGAVLQDVTRNEFQREQIAAKARDVIQKNVKTVQEVARLFGEHIAETEIMLNEIAGSYESKTVGVSYNGGDSDSYLNG